MSHERFMIATCVLLIAACGDDDDQGPSRVPYQSGVTVTTTGPGGAPAPVSSLDASQLRQLCTSFDAHVQAQIGFEAIAYIACLPPAIVLGGSPAGCEQQLDQCMRAFPEPIEIEAMVTNETVCFDDLRACEASVAALEGCVNVNLDLVFDILDNWTCGGAGDASQRAAAERAMDTVAVCADLGAGCNRFATVDVE